MSYSSNQPFVKVFFALWPKVAERGELASWQVTLKPLCKGRAMRPETLHATLVFIGDIEQSRLEALQLAAQEVSAECFTLRFDAARYWGHNHIVYAAPEQTPPQLQELVGGLERSLIRHRFKFDRRAYKPHATLLRNAHWTDVSLPEMSPVRWLIRDFALVQSVLQGGQTNYHVLARFALSDPA